MFSNSSVIKNKNMQYFQRPNTNTLATFCKEINAPVALVTTGINPGWSVLPDTSMRKLVINSSKQG